MIAIIDYGVGNLNSIYNMLERVGANAVISGSEDVISRADKLILPGMGHFDNCMVKIKSSGLLKIIEHKVFVEGVPILGICVGLQMLMGNSEEGDELGLAWIPGRTVRFDFKLESGLKIPNMGWHEVKKCKESLLTRNFVDNARFYFAHSYHVILDHYEDCLMEAEYGYRYVVALEHKNILGVQFHPEKSHKYGMKLLENFVKNY
jgi:glutamine amidotransferase